MFPSLHNRYNCFLAGGRRLGISLEDILKFVTGSPIEPLFGFSMAPSLVFDANIVLPRANTCINQLRLPMLNRDSDFENAQPSFPK